MGVCWVCHLSYLCSDFRERERERERIAQIDPTSHPSRCILLGKLEISQANCIS